MKRKFATLSTRFAAIRLILYGSLPDPDIADCNALQFLLGWLSESVHLYDFIITYSISKKHFIELKNIYIIHTKLYLK